MSPHCHTFIQALRDKGYRLTPQREMVIEVLARSGRHMTAEEVFAAVLKRTHAVNIATVYRTLDLLVAEGLASKGDLGAGCVVYATVRHGTHLHLVCRRCGQVVEADGELAAALRTQVEQKYGFAADLSHLAISGLCRECASAERESGTPAE